MEIWLTETWKPRYFIDIVWVVWLWKWGIMHSNFHFRRLQRTAVKVEVPQPVKNSEQEAVNMSTDEIDSLIEGLILEKQTGGYFEKALHDMGNKVHY